MAEIQLGDKIQLGQALLYMTCNFETVMGESPLPKNLVTTVVSLLTILSFPETVTENGVEPSDSHLVVFIATL